MMSAIDLIEVSVAIAVAEIDWYFLAYDPELLILLRFLERK